MGLILRVGPGIKKIDFPIGKLEFKILKEFTLGKGKIKVEKTNSNRENNNWLINKYRFGYYNEQDELEGYIMGHAQGKDGFYLNKVKNEKSEDKRMTQLQAISSKTKKRIYNFFGLKEQNPKKIIYSRNLFYLWNKTKEYLKEKGVKNLFTQAEFEIIDTVEFDLKLGWKDFNQERKIEQYLGNPEERKKHYTPLEKLTGTVYLKYNL